MVLKQGLRLVLLLSAMVLSAQASQASSSFPGVVNSNLGNGASISCNACHNGATNASTATFPMASTYISARSAGDFTILATADSDGDGYANKFEVNGAAVEFNDAAVSPFTKATGANATTTNMKTLADTAAVDTAFTDPQGLAAAGTTVLGGIKVTLNQADTVYFKAGGVNTTATIYTVDSAGAGTTIASTDWSVNTDGSLVIRALPAGATTADYIVVSTGATTVAAAGHTVAASTTGCLTTSITMPVVLFGLLSLMGLVARRPQAFIKNTTHKM